MRAGTLVGLLAAGESHEDILRLYPYVEPADFGASLVLAAETGPSVIQMRTAFSRP